jgi:hypothetical protein
MVKAIEGLISMSVEAGLTWVFVLVAIMAA